jgi:hypothetical protein
VSPSRETIVLALPEAATSAEEASRLTRRLDWRFLLPEPRLRRVIYAGESTSSLARALEALSESVSFAGLHGDPCGEADLVVAQSVGRQDLERVMPRLVSGGWLYWELKAGQSPSAADLDWLARWGVSQVRTFCNLPDFEDRRWIVPLDHSGGFAMLLKRRFAAVPPKVLLKCAGVLSQSRIARRRMAISLIGRRGPAGHPGTFAHRFAEAEGEMLDPTAVPWHRPYLVATPSFASSRSVVLLMEPGASLEASLVAKIARVEGDADTFGREAENLRALQLDHPAAEAPRLRGHAMFDGHEIVMESGVPGQLMQPRVVRRAPAACIDAVMTWLEDLHQATRVPASEAPGRIATLVESSLARLEPIVARETASQELLKHVRRMTGRLGTLGVPLVFEHGDLSSPNLLRLRDGRAGVLDWELANRRGLPAVDLYFFLAFVAFARERATTPDACVAAFRQAFFGRRAWARPYIDRYAASVGVPRPALGPLFLLCWSRYLANLPDRMAWAVGRGVGTEELAQVRRDRYWHLWKYAAEHREEFQESLQ